MGMQSVQVRLSKEQLELIDEEVRQGRYPNRSEAIRDHLRKAQFYKVLERLLELGDREEGSEAEIKADLERVREKVYTKLIAPKCRK
jgi:Arc/MetJ-type ribon-helix-helix transcriptional regulator